MSLTAEEKYELYLRNNPVGQRPVEILEMYYSTFGSIYFSNEEDGVTVTLEDDSEVFCKGALFEIQKASSSDDLEEEFSISFNDTDSEIQRLIMPIVIEDVDEDDYEDRERVIVKYRVYMADDLTEAAVGPINFEAPSFAFDGTNGTATCKTPSAVTTRTGELYEYDRFPGLYAFL